MMILRQTLCRPVGQIFQGPARSWTRSLATEVSRIGASLDNQLKETHSIEAQLQAQTPTTIPRINNQTHASKFYDVASVARNHRSRNRQKTTTGRLGSNVAPHYEPVALLQKPPSPSEITLELLLASQSHLGHHTSLWNPMNSRYIFGIRQGIHIISLDVTAAHLRRACRVVAGVAERGGLILFVGTRAGLDKCVVRAAQLAGGYHLFERWMPGSITNGHQILSRCRTKVVDEFDRDLDGFEEELRERPALKPDLVVCLNPLENWVLLHECGMNGIPTVGIIDTDANPTWVTYPIPANDDSMRCVQLIAGILGRAGEEGQRARMECAARGIVTYTPTQFGSEDGEQRGRDLGGRSEEG